MTKVICVLAAIAGVLASSATVAAPRHAIAMHGEPALPADFQQFPYADPAARPGGSLRTAMPGTFDTLNPYTVRGRRAAGWTHSIETLMARSWDEPFTLYGLIAETVETPADRSWVQFVLREEARWHDGTPITAEDIVFSWAILRDQGRPNHRTYYKRIERADAIDAKTVRFTFARVAGGSYDREMPLVMAQMPVLSQAWWQNRAFDQTTLEPLMGSGPYRIGAMEAGRYIEYHRDPDYWGRDLPVNRHLYNFDTIRYDYYRDNTIAIEAFKAGNLDYRRETDPGRWRTAYTSPALDDGRILLERIPHGRPEPARALIFNTRRPPFDDRLVRLAFNHALDFEWMNRALFHGAYNRTESYYPNSELAARGLPGPLELAQLDPLRSELPSALFEEPFALPQTDGSGPSGLRRNLRRASALLREAGYPVRGGRRIGRDGQPVSFEILLADSSDERVALEFARGLERLGVEARVRTVDSAQYTERLAQFDFDMTIHYWISTLSPGNEQLFYFGSAAADQAGSRNYAGIRSDAVDTLAASLGTAPSREELVARSRALDRALLWGYYTVPLFHLGADLIARWSHIRRPAVTPLYGVVVEAWWSSEP